MKLDKLYNDTAIFVDLDETLVRTTTSLWSLLRYMGFKFELGHLKNLSHDELNNILNENNIKVIEDYGYTYYSVLRPHAHEFLNRLRGITDNLFILTSGDYTFQSKVLAVHNLHLYFEDVFGGNNYDVPKYKKFVLIDDLGVNTSGIKTKMTKLGAIEYRKHLVHIEPWFGNPSDNTLITILPEVREKLRQ